MYVKKLKRKCSVRGCKSTDTFAISRNREVGNTVILCRECIEQALEATDGSVPVPEVKAAHTTAPALFFNAKALGRKPVFTNGLPKEAVAQLNKNQAISESDTPPSDDAEDEATPVDNTVNEGVDCPVCGKVCKSENGLQKHIAAAHKDFVATPNEAE